MAVSRDRLSRNKRSFAGYIGKIGGLPAAPANTVAPSIAGAGAAKVGVALNASDGTWTGRPSPAFAVRWQRSNDGATGWTDVAGAAAASYTPVPDDIGKYLRVVVTATSSSGSASAPSAATVAVVAA